jgi:hypothetical protein
MTKDHGPSGQDPVFSEIIGEMSIRQQVDALRSADEAGKWGIREKDLKRLAATAPAWPKARNAYRSLRIRFGDGHAGVIKTYHAHCEHLGRVHRGNWCDVKVQFDPRDRDLRLSAGDQTHHPCLEWVIIRQRLLGDGDAVSGAMGSADEVLAFAWLFAEACRRSAVPRILVASGYEAYRIEEYDPDTHRREDRDEHRGSWRNAVVVQGIGRPQSRGLGVYAFGAHGIERNYKGRAIMSTVVS